MAKKPDKREVCEKLFAHRIKQRQGLQRNQRAVDNASSTGENEKSPGLRPAAKDQLPSPSRTVKGAIARSQGYAGFVSAGRTIATKKAPRPGAGPSCLTGALCKWT